MNMRATDIAEVYVVKTVPFVDDRGSFARLFCELDLNAVIAGRRVVQINHSRTNSIGAIRGLHYQRPPYAEMKLVRCQRGRVWDVVVDLRAGSPSFLNWHAEELTQENGSMMVIPEGCAHGFQVLEPRSEVLYLHTAPYAPHFEGGIRFDDPRVAISWPLPVGDISQRDRTHELISPDFRGVVI